MSSLPPFTPVLVPSPSFVQEEVKTFEAMLQVERAKRLEKRKQERKAKRKAEAAAAKRAEEEELCEGGRECGGEGGASVAKGTRKMPICQLG